MAVCDRVAFVHIISPRVSRTGFGLSSFWPLLFLPFCFTPSERAQAPRGFRALWAPLTGSLTSQERDPVHRRAVRVQLLCDSHCVCAVGHLTVSYCTPSVLSLSLSLCCSSSCLVLAWILSKTCRVLGAFLYRRRSTCVPSVQPQPSAHCSAAVCRWIVTVGRIPSRVSVL